MKRISKNFFLGIIAIGVLSLPAFADIVHLKDGKVFEATVEEKADGYWADGIFFARNEVMGIERRPVEENNTDALQEGSSPRKNLLTNQQIRPQKLKSAMARWEQQTTQRIESVLERMGASDRSVTISLLVILLVYLLGVLPLYLIGRKLRITHPWTTWVPVLQFFSVIRMAGMSWKWGALVFGLIPAGIMFLSSALMLRWPLVGVVFLIFTAISIPLFLLILWIYVWIRITKACQRSMGLVLVLVVLSFAGLIFTLYSIYNWKTPILGTVFFWDGFDILQNGIIYLFLWYLALGKLEPNDAVPINFEDMDSPPPKSFKPSNSPNPPALDAKGLPDYKIPPPYRG